MDEPQQDPGSWRDPYDSVLARVIGFVVVVVPLGLWLAFLFGGRFATARAGGWSVRESLLQILFVPVALALLAALVHWMRTRE